MKSVFLLVICLVSIVYAKPSVQFKKGILEIGGKKISIEIARSDDERSQGLMNRKHLDKNAGMLFIFEQEHKLSFWMKNTLIPLSIGFFDRNQRLVDVQEMVPFDKEQKTYESKKPALYALEMNAKWFYENKIPLGTKFTFTEK